MSTKHTGCSAKIGDNPTIALLTTAMGEAPTLRWRKDTQIQADAWLLEGRGENSHQVTLALARERRRWARGAY